MTKSQLGLLGSLLAAGALTIAGCGDSGGGGTGGKIDGGTGGRGGAAAGGTTGTGGRGGAAGSAAGGAGGTTVTDGGTDNRPDSGAGGSGTGDGGSDTGPCTTSFGAGNRALFAFNNGTNIGWTAGVEGDPANWGLADSLSIGGTSTDGDTCPGALTLTVPFMSSGIVDAGGQAQIALKYTGYYGNPLDWTGYGNLHMSVKFVSSSLSGLGVQSYAGLITTTTPTMYPYRSTNTAISDSAWHKVTVALTPESPATTRVNELGARIQINVGPTTPPTLQVLIDDIWLEAAPAPDAGPDTPADTGVDVPAIDAGVDVPAVDTGTDATAG